MVLAGDGRGTGEPGDLCLTLLDHHKVEHLGARCNMIAASLSISDFTRPSIRKVSLELLSDKFYDYGISFEKKSARTQ
jgi:hypothetical protein